MELAPLPNDEIERQAALSALQVLDTPPDPRFDDITQRAAQALNVPYALISLVDGDRQWFKSACGMSQRETRRDISFCGHAILQSEPLLIPDTLMDRRFIDNPLVVGPPYIRFYCGMPLQLTNGYRVGTLCVLDQRPRHLSAEQLEQLRALADAVQSELERT